MAIHWFVLLMKRTILCGSLHTMMAAASRIMFFASVCQLERISASPKHPQSFTGSATAIHTVIIVITAMKASTSRLTMRRLMAKSRKMPRQNSTAERRTDAESVA